MPADAAARAAGVPGLVIRPFAGEADLAAFVRVINAEYEADGIDERRTEGGERAWFGAASEQFDARRDVVMAELDGQAVAFAGQEWIDTRDGELREYRLWGAVDPAYRRRGIGATLLADNERRARGFAATHAAERRMAFASFAAEGRPAARLLEAAGYEVVRWFFEMVRPSLDGLADLPMPDGLELRPVTRDQYVALWRANREAFRDHWGGSDESEAAMNRFFDQPDSDSSLWLVAWDGDEIAGGVMNGISPEENAALGIQRGLLHSVFTRRPWRRRGLARALIAKSLVLLRDRGMTSAALGVDADNPLGALGLYEEAGFAVAERFNAWRKPMEEGAPMSQISETLDLADAPAIPGLTFRRYRGPEEHPSMLRVYHAAHHADGLDDVTTLERFNLNYSTLVNCDPQRDIVLAEVDGAVVAYARVFWTDQVDGSRSYENFGFVHPEWRRRGIGGALHRRNEERLREIAATHPDVQAKWLSSEGMDTAVGNVALLEGSGFTPVRYFYDMVAPTLEGIAAPPMPEGLEVRPVSRDQFRAIWDASVEAFRDHWGEPEQAEEDWQRFENEPDHSEQPFWMVGWDGDEVAGAVVTTVPTQENEEHGRARVWVEAVSVRRPWRRRGLAKALLARSLLAAREAGFTSAGLGVDTENPTGALGLYESLGFAPERRGIAYRKPL